MKTWVYIDHFKGEPLPASWEAIGVGKTLGNVTALVFGSGVEAVANAAFEYGADEVLLADDAALEDFRAEAYASTLSAVASSQSPDLILFPTTTRGRELAGMAAIDLNTGEFKWSVRLGEFEELIAPWIDRTLRCCEQALKDFEAVPLEELADAQLQLRVFVAQRPEEIEHQRHGLVVQRRPGHALQRRARQRPSLVPVGGRRAAHGRFHRSVDERSRRMELDLRRRRHLNRPEPELRLRDSRRVHREPDRKQCLRFGH